MISKSEKLSESLKKVIAQSVKVPVNTEEVAAPETIDAVVETEKPSSGSPFDDIRSSIRSMKVQMGKARLGSVADANRALQELDILSTNVDRAQKYQI